METQLLPCSRFLTSHASKSWHGKCPESSEPCKMRVCIPYYRNMVSCALQESLNLKPWHNTNPTPETPLPKPKTPYAIAPMLFPLSPQFHPMMPCLSTCVCLTNPTLLPMMPSPPTPKSSFRGKLNDSVVNVDNGKACNTDVISSEALRSPSRLLRLSAFCSLKHRKE